MDFEARSSYRSLRGTNGVCLVFATMLFQLALHRTVERLTSARQSGHDGSHGNAQRRCQLPVRKALQLAQHEQFPRTNGQAPHRPLDQANVFGLKRQRFRIADRSSSAVLFFIERVGWGSRALAAPAETGVANDSEQPRTPISAGVRMEISKRPQQRLLEGIFRIVHIPQEPAGQPKGGREVR